MTLTTFFLTFGHLDFIACLLLLGSFWVGKKHAYNLLYLIAFSLIFNVALKDTFQIPLSPSLGKAGFAFPSGHMQLATVFYAGLVYQLKNKFIHMIIAPFILAGVGWSLIDAGFHNLADVCAGATVGYSLIYFYNLLLNYGENRVKNGGLLAVSLLLGYIYLQQGFIPDFAYWAYFLILLDRCIVICFFKQTPKKITL